MAHSTGRQSPLEHQRCLLTPRFACTYMPCPACTRPIQFDSLPRTGSSKAGELYRARAIAPDRLDATTDENERLNDVIWGRYRNSFNQPIDRSTTVFTVQGLQTPTQPLVFLSIRVCDVLSTGEEVKSIYKIVASPTDTVSQLMTIWQPHLVLGSSRRCLPLTNVPGAGYRFIDQRNGKAIDLGKTVSQPSPHVAAANCNALS
jgi:hypothetical protein